MVKCLLKIMPLKRKTLVRRILKHFKYLLVFHYNITLLIRNRMKKLEQEEVDDFLKQHLKNWTFEDNKIHRDLKFGTFIQAFSFMTAIALEAEKADHHPDWSNSYNKINITLTTHSEGGVTQADLDLAVIVNSLYRKYE
jgi:4a-hydroxytetrahydrobiopterin dehydratase